MYGMYDIQMVRGERAILSIDRLTIPTNQLTVILGHNGSGKSTLASLLSGQQKPDSGKITLHGRDLLTYRTKALAREVAFLPQKLPASVGLTVRELVRLGRFAWRGTFRRWNSEDERIIEDSLAKTGIQSFRHNLADTLSGGERQRAWVAMLLAQQAPLLILDEPTSALDIHHQYQLMALLADLNRDQHCGIMVILHDINLALRYATHILALKNGQVAFEGPVDVLLDEQTLSELYHSRIRLMEHPDPARNSRTNKVAVVCT